MEVPKELIKGKIFPSWMTKESLMKKKAISNRLTQKIKMLN